MTRIEVRYRGMVQGVGFRATACSVAREFAVAGWVRNEPDGSVYLVAEGPAEEVERFLDRLASRMREWIESADRIESAPKGEQGFTVRR